MLNFISINMARALPMSLIFGLGLFLIQKGLKRFNPQLRIYPLFLFICYWLSLSAGFFKGTGPTDELDWITFMGLLSPIIGVLFYVISFIVSSIRKRLQLKDEEIQD